MYRTSRGCPMLPTGGRFSYRKLLTALAIAAATVGGGSAAAQDGPADIVSLTGAADLVIQGRVTKVEYKMSPAAGSNRGIPFTFVSYDISRVVRGDPARKTITLRFIGGSDGQGRFLQVSDMPLFQVGDEDILFVQGDSGTNCPLVGCIEGRFRVLNGAVYDGYGAPVQRIAGDRVESGGMPPDAFLSFKYPAPAFEDLIKNPEVVAAIRKQGLTIDQARQRHRAKGPAHVEIRTVVSQQSRQEDSPGTGGGAPAPKRQQAKPMQVSAFLATVGQAAGSAPATGPVGDADSRSRLSVPSAEAVAPSPPPQSRARARSAEDIAEEATLPKDDLTITRNKAR